MTSNYVYETKQKGQIILLEHGVKKHCLDSNVIFLNISTNI